MNVTDKLQRSLRNFLRYPALSQYVFYPICLNLPIAYMLLEFIGLKTAELLVDTFGEQRKNPV